MFSRSGVGEDSGSIVLDQLESVGEFGEDTREERAAVVQVMKAWMMVSVQ